MTRNTNYAYVSAAQKVLWKAELSSLMVDHAVLADCVPLLDSAMFFSNDLRCEFAPVMGQPQLLAYRDSVLPKFVVVIFEVLQHHHEITSTAIEHAMIEITLYAQVSSFNEEPFVNLVVSPDGTEPVVFLTHTTGRGSSKLVATTVGLNDLLDQFPGQAENVLTQISFVTGVIEDSHFLRKQTRGAA